MGSFNKVFFKYRIYDILVILLCFVIGGVFYYIEPCYQNIVTISDTDYPNHTNNYSIFFLLGYIIISGFMICFLCKKFLLDYSPFSIVLYYFFGISVTWSIANILSYILKRPRPDTLQLCGSVSLKACQEVLSKKSFRQQFKSFPSVHTSIAAASASFTVSFFDALFRSLKNNNLFSFATIIITLCPVYGVFFACMNRVWDFSNHTEDVVTGVLIGVSIGLLSFHLFMNEMKSKQVDTTKNEDEITPTLN